MKQGIALSLAVAVLSTLPACTASKLMQEWEEYKPSEFYETQVRPAAAVEIAPTPRDKDFEAEKTRLEEMKTRWERALEEPGKEARFFTPAPDRLKALLPAASDTAVAEKALDNGFSLETLETIAFLRNPGVKAAGKNFKAALEGYSQAANLDEILRQYTAFTGSLMTGVGPMKGREPVAMKFPFPGVLSLKGEIVTQEVKAAGETLEIARRTAVVNSRTAYWDRRFIHRSQAITSEMLNLYKHLKSVATALYDSGKTSFQDVIKVQIEQEVLEEALKTLKEEQRTIEVKILELLDLPPGVKVGLPAAVEPERGVPPLNPLYKIASERKQELRRLRDRIGKMERLILMAETAIYPVYSLNFSLYGDEAINQAGSFRTREPFTDTTRASLGAGLPKMPWYGKNDAYLRETRYKLDALREELKRTENSVSSHVRQAWFRLDRANREETLFAQSVVNLSQAALEASTRGYEAGKVSFADVIASYTNRLRANLSLARKQSDLGVSRAELQEAVGAAWERPPEEMR